MQIALIAAIFFRDSRRKRNDWMIYCKIYNYVIHTHLEEIRKSLPTTGSDDISSVLFLIFNSPYRYLGRNHFYYPYESQFPYLINLNNFRCRETLKWIMFWSKGHNPYGFVSRHDSSPLGVFSENNQDSGRFLAKLRCVRPPRIWSSKQTLTMMKEKRTSSVMYCLSLPTRRSD